VTCPKKSGKAFQKGGLRYGPYMEGPDGYRETLQEIERPSPLERGLRGHQISGWHTII